MIVRKLSSKWYGAIESRPLMIDMNFRYWHRKIHCSGKGLR